MNTENDLPGLSNDVYIPAGKLRLPGMLAYPRNPRGIVLFAHGSGSSRHSPRNQFVAMALRHEGFATLLMDLLGPAEAEDRDLVFDIPFLAKRLLTAADWLSREPPASALPLGLFGASTGAAAALVAAATRPDRVGAVVSRGGRPDLAWDLLPDVSAPTRLIVGGDDEPVLQWNRDALARLRCEKDLVVIPGATHLFPEPGAFEVVARLAVEWFDRHLDALTESASRAKKKEADHVS